MSSRVFRLAVTTGDPDGIGTEVAAKALVKLKPRRNVRIYLWRSSQTPAKHLRWIDQQFERVVATSLEEALALGPLKPRQLVDIHSDLSPGHWVEASAQACVKGELDGIATGPLSKTTLREAGFHYLGHTELLKKVSQSPALFMGFLGQRFNVLSMTGHIPLQDVPARLTPELMETALVTAWRFCREVLKSGNKPLALVGLNPHAGEQGLIGLEEDRLYGPVLQKVRESGVRVEGPLVPDAAFFPSQWKKYSFYLCPYHDQALIPFKLVHTQNSGAHITLGLPFVRTSVDHGTAKDIFNKNKANPNSMLDALKWAIRLIEMRSR